MPVMDGYEFLEEFYKTPYSQTVPVFISTGLSSIEKRDNKLAEYEIFDFIIKPLGQVNKDILINKIRMGIKYRVLLKELSQLKLKRQKDNQDRQE